jgi:hypothetical protein
MVSALQLQSNRSRRWASYMLVGAILAGFLILGLFLSMLSDSPKSDPEVHSDTEL